MAFSATVRGVGPIGAGNMRAVYGDWSGVAGDAAGTITFAGRYIGSLWFQNDSTTATTGPATNVNATQVFPSVQWDGNANPGTLTIQNQANVGTGSFIIFSLGS